MATIQRLLRPTPRALAYSTPLRTISARLQPRLTIRQYATEPPKTEEREPIRLLSEVDARGRKLPDKVTTEDYSPTYKFFAWLRLGLGLVLMGALAYDMV